MHDDRLFLQLVQTPQRSRARKSRLAREIAANYLGLAVEGSAWREELEQRSGAWVSCSYCPGYLVVAVAAYPIGVDIEIRTPRTLSLEHITTPGERANLSPEEFYPVWCLKEAAMKLTRRTFAMLDYSVHREHSHSYVVATPAALLRGHVQVRGALVLALVHPQ